MKGKLIIIIKEYTNPVMHNALAHHPLTDTWPAFPLAYMLSKMSYGMKYPFGQLDQLVLAVSPHSFSSRRSWEGRGSMRSW